MLKNHSHIKIIAEAGVNHNGSLEKALEMIDAASKAQADYIKFQTFRTSDLVTENCGSASYQKANTGFKTQAEMLKTLELSYDDFNKINDYCKEKGIGFLSTPFDSKSLDFLLTLKPDYIKIPSGEITNLPFLRKIAASKFPIIMSTGMCEISDIEAALKPFENQRYSQDKITLLHCTTQYPTPFDDVNLNAMSQLKVKFGYDVGYSDHTRGLFVPIAAAAAGAKIIEKHFTLSRDLEGPDHNASLIPEELAEMVRQIREIEIILGDKEKKITPSEQTNINAARRSIVAARFIKKGEILTEENITAKRPGNGVTPMSWDKVIGTKAIHDFFPDEQIEL